MRARLRTAAAFGLLLLAGCGSDGPPAKRILLVTIDTLRADRLGYVGYDVATPNLDRLASEGAFFTQAITAAPITLPAHTSILSGLYPTNHGVRHNGLFRVSDDVETVAESLRAAGYATGAFIGAFVLDRRYGLEQGFDHYDDELPEESDVHRAYYPERRAEEVVARALEWIEARDTAAFFAWVHLFDPHAPYNAPSPFRERYRGRDYDAEVAYTDAALGPLLDVMDALDDAAVIVTADHGEGLGEHGESTHTLFVYDSTMRVPLIVKAPGVAAGTRVDRQVRSVDIAPTILALSGRQPSRAIDGVRLFSENERGDLAAYGETFGTRYQFNWSELRFLRQEGFKVVDAPRPELYDLGADPGEENNLWSENPPDVGRRLLRELRVLSEDDVPSATVEIDAESRKRLESLGYVAASAANGPYVERPDPKDRVEIFEALQFLLDPGLSAEEQIAGYRDLLETEPTNTLARSRLANLLAKEERLEDAVLEYQELLRVSEIDSSGWENLASALLLLDRTEEALAITERAVASAPWYRELQVLRGEALEKAGRLEEALVAYENAIELRPGVPENYWRRGTVALALEDEKSAESDFREALLRDASFQEGRIALARLLSRTGRAEEAAELVAEGASDDPEMKTALAEAYLASERSVEARALLEEAIAGDPENARAYALLGPTYGRAGALDEAAAALEKAVALGETGADVRRNLGLVYLRQQRSEEAIGQLLAASEDSPDDPAVWFTLGNAHLASRQGVRAAGAYEQALSLRPGWPEATFNLALAYESTGTTEKAAEAFRRFLAGAGAADAEKRGEAERRLANLER